MPVAMSITLALSKNSEERTVAVLDEWVKLKPSDVNGLWTSRTVCAIVAPHLCTDVILGLPFLTANRLVMDYEDRTCISKDNNFNLLQPKVEEAKREACIPLQQKHKELRKFVRRCHREVMEEIKAKTTEQRKRNDEASTLVKLDVIGAVCDRLEQLANGEHLIYI
jgi:hypothetical protein